MHGARDREREKSGRLKPPGPPAALTATVAAESQQQVARAGAIDHSNRFGGSGAVCLVSPFDTTAVIAHRSVSRSPAACNLSIESRMTVNHWRPSSSGPGSISITVGSVLLMKAGAPTLASTQRSRSSENGEVPCWAFFLAQLHAVISETAIALGPCECELRAY